jgi:serine/threonine-protein kinase
MTSQARLVGGRYEEGESLGRGGMAEVRKGVDNRLGRTVAIKRLRIDLASDPTFQARFRREAQSAASLNHPSIVAVYDTGEEPDPNGSGVVVPYIVMEYVAGKTLRDLIREGRKILPERALEITAGVLEALDYSHRAGIVHRDIKPGNVMLTPYGAVKVMDFGIARAVADTSATMTQTAAVIGTAQYLSPEQARGETVDARSDLYSTGCQLYELLTGRPPFVGESPVSVAYQHVREQPAPPSSLDPDISPEIDAVVLKALAKNREHRYQSAAEMRQDIHRVLAGQQVTAPMAAVAETRVVPTTANAPTVAAGIPAAGAGAAGDDLLDFNDPDDPDDPDARARRGRGFGYFLLGLAIVALAVGGYLIWQQFSGEKTPQQIAVPTVTGKLVEEAKRDITDNGLAVGEMTSENSTTVPQNRVIRTKPPANSQVDPNTRIDLVVSSGPPSYTIPDVVGDDYDDAKRTLEDSTGKFTVEKKDVASEKPEGTVIDQSPDGDTKAGRGAKITLEVSSGKVEVPDVANLSQADATNELKNKGFLVAVVLIENDEFQDGQAINTDPPKGTMAKYRSKVTLHVAKPKSEPTPTNTPTTTPTDPGTSPTEEPTGPTISLPTGSPPAGGGPGTTTPPTEEPEGAAGP